MLFDPINWAIQKSHLHPIYSKESFYIKDQILYWSQLGHSFHSFSDSTFFRMSTSSIYPSRFQKGQAWSIFWLLLWFHDYKDIKLFNFSLSISKKPSWVTLLTHFPVPLPLGHQPPLSFILIKKAQAGSLFWLLPWFHNL